jgi:ketosteroid isomerase-like protein
MSLSDADRLAILDIVTRADEAASRRDADGYVALFDPDAVLDGAQGRHAGREAMRASVGPIWAAEGPATLHLTLNPVVETGSGDGRAVVRSVLLIVDPADPPAIRATALITQELSRNSGSWRITRRTVAPAGPDRPSGLARLSAAGADTIAPNYGLREGAWRAGSSRVESISARWNP